MSGQREKKKVPSIRERIQIKKKKINKVGRLLTYMKTNNILIYYYKPPYYMVASAAPPTMGGLVVVSLPKPTLWGVVGFPPVSLS
jgi:hypothetical protein